MLFGKRSIRLCQRHTHTKKGQDRGKNHKAHTNYLLRHQLPCNFESGFLNSRLNAAGNLMHFWWQGTKYSADAKNLLCHVHKQLLKFKARQHLSGRTKLRIEPLCADAKGAFYPAASGRVGGRTDNPGTRRAPASHPSKWMKKQQRVSLLCFARASHTRLTSHCSCRTSWRLKRFATSGWQRMALGGIIEPVCVCVCVHIIKLPFNKAPW